MKCDLAYAFGLGLTVSVCEYHEFVVVLTPSRAYVYGVLVKDDCLRLRLECVTHYDRVYLDYEGSKVTIVGTDDVFECRNPKVIVLRGKKAEEVMC